MHATELRSITKEEVYCPTEAVNNSTNVMFSCFQAVGVLLLEDFSKDFLIHSGQT